MKSFSFLIPAMALLAACGGAPDNASTNEATGAVMMQQRIDSMRAELEDDTLYNARAAQELLDVYKAYAKVHPLDTLSAEYLFRAAGMSDPLGRPDESIALYDRVIRDYPGWDRLADCYYLKALTIDKMGRKGEAKTAYEEVIARFPDHQFAHDARQMIENMMYTDEELIAKFKAQNDLEAAKGGKEEKTEGGR